MSNSLQNTITHLASTFATDILNALRGMSLEEILAATGKAPGARTAAASRPSAPAAQRKAPKGRLGRRSPADIAGTVNQIVALLQKHKGGLRSEQIRSQLGLDKKEMPRPLAEGLAAKKLTKKGQKRSTTYFAR